MAGPRGSLRIYLGAAAGAGTTAAMVAEGRRRADLGQNVVVAALDSGARSLGSMEPLLCDPGQPLRRREVIAARPDLVVVDDLAATGPRWKEVDRLLDDGLDVLTTMVVTDLESMADIAERVGAPLERSCVPDDLVEQAQEVQFVDMTPEALRERFRGGEIVAVEAVDARTAQGFRFESLAALRELSLYWLAQRVDGSLNAYLDSHSLAPVMAPRERVVVAVTGAPGNEGVVTRAARLARRSRGDLIGVHVRGKVQPTGVESRLAANRALLEKLGGRWVEVRGEEPAGALVSAARSERATQLVVGASRRSRWHSFVYGSIVQRLARELGDIDLHVLSAAADPGPGPIISARPARLDRRRVAAAWLTAVIGVAMVTIVGRAAQPDTHAGPLLGYLLVVALVAGLGGFVPGIVCAVVTFLLGNWFFTPPVGSWGIQQVEDLVVLVVFVAVAMLVALLVSANARRAAEAGRARAEAELLARSTGALVGEAEPARSLLELLAEVFELKVVAVLDADGAVAEAVGDLEGTYEETDQFFDLGEGRRLVLRGTTLTPDDRRLVSVFASEVDVALTGAELRRRAEEARALDKANQFRTALLQSVSHDLRTPLTSIKASVTTLMHDELPLGSGDRRELLGTVEEEADRLNRVVGNLLDASRLQAGAIKADLREVGVEEEVVAAALQAVGASADEVEVALPADLPSVWADPGLLEQAVVNLVANARSWSSEFDPVRIDAGPVEDATLGGAVVLRIIDRGPGIPAAGREGLFEAFQRLGDRSSQSGVGLGLAVARGFVGAMGGRVELEDTPGGGTTATITLRRA